MTFTNQQHWGQETRYGHLTSEQLVVEVDKNLNVLQLYSDLGQNISLIEAPFIEEVQSHKKAASDGLLKLMNTLSPNCEAINKLRIRYVHLNRDLIKYEEAFFSPQNCESPNRRI
jgi:hypothetical protein